MKIGVCYPVTEVAGNPDDIRKFVKAAEELGFEHLMTPDHVLKCRHEGREPKLNGPYTEKDSFYDPFVFFGFVAGLTDKLDFVTGVLVLPQRQTALVAQQAADVDLISRERLRLGVGIGWNYVEYDGLGQNFKTRGKRIEEQIDLLRQLWAKPIVDFEGRFDRIDRAGINPRPRRQIPIWLGGVSEPAFERGARIGDGFIFAGTGASAVEGWGRVKHHLNALGKSEESFGRQFFAYLAQNAQESADHLKIWRDTGGTHGTMHSMSKGLGNNIDAHIDYVANIKRLVDQG